MVIVRKKKHRSGTVSVQVIDKSSGRSRVLYTVGSSKDIGEVGRLVDEAKRWIERYGGQQVLDLSQQDDRAFMTMLDRSKDQVQMLGQELIQGSLYDQIGFGRIREDLLRYLVLSRLVYPGSELRLEDYFFA